MLVSALLRAIAVDDRDDLPATQDLPRREFPDARPHRYDARVEEKDPPIEYELLSDAVAARPIVSDTKIAPTLGDDDKHVRIEGRFASDEDDDDDDDGPDGAGSNDEPFAFGFIYAVGVLSFADARPRGVSGMHYQEKDDWTATDMLRHLRFEHGELHFHADYVRGRCMKTTIIIRGDGSFLVETINRGEAATRWIAKLQGEKILSVVTEACDA